MSDGPARRPARQSALEVIRDLLQDQVEELVEVEADVREDRDDSVHQLRTAVRKLRAMLRASSGVLAPATIEDLRERLAEFGAALEPARDAEVRAGIALSLGAVQRDPLVRERLVGSAHAEYRRRHSALLTMMAGPAHEALIRELDALIVRPPLGDKAFRPHRKVVAATLAREVRRALHRVEALDTSDLESLHEVRKAARRVRYLAKAVSDAPAAVKGTVEELIDSAKGLQGNLGDHRDLVLEAEWADLVALLALDQGEDAQPYRRTAEEARARSRDVEAERDAAMKRFRKAAKAHSGS